MNDIINSCKTTNLQIQKQNKDIVCYKIFKIIKGEYVGPFTDYNFGKLKSGDIIYPSYISKSANNLSLIDRLLKKINFSALTNKHSILHFGITYNLKHKWYDITNGFIHTLPYRPDNLLHYCDDWASYELWQCVIPANTSFFQANCRGSHYEWNGTYASTKLKLIKKLNSVTIE